MNRRAAGRRAVTALAGAVALPLSVALAGAPAAAAPPDPSPRAHVFQTWFAGEVAMASWDTCDGDEPVGTTCRFTEVQAFSAATRELATGEFRERSPRTPVVRLHEGTCEVVDLDRERTCALRSERFGRSTTGRVTVSPQLERATAVAAGLRVQTWEQPGVDGTGVVDVEATWAGTGERQRVDERSRLVDRFAVLRSSTRGWERACTATARLDGTAVAGELVGCSLLRVRQGEVRVFPGGSR
jgi:hypothetical protein